MASRRLHLGGSRADMFLADFPTREDSESFNILAKVATSVQGELSPTTQQEALAAHRT